MLRGIPVEIETQGPENAEDNIMSFQIVHMSQNDEYNVILGVLWLKAYTGLCKPFEITTKERTRPSPESFGVHAGFGQWV